MVQGGEPGVAGEPFAQDVDVDGHDQMLVEARDASLGAVTCPQALRILESKDLMLRPYAVPRMAGALICGIAFQIRWRATTPPARP